MATAAKSNLKLVKKSGRKECAVRARRSEPKLKPLAYIFEERDRAVRRGEFEIMGRLMVLRMEQGDIDFLKGGPFIGRLKTKEAPLVLLNEWAGLPNIISLHPQLCDACRTDCDCCGAKGKRLCMHLNCGGEGRVILTYKACPGEDCVVQKHEIKPGCETCHGAGRVPDQVQECPQCKGTKEQTCPKCQGSGKMATGRKNGAGPSPDDFDSTGRMVDGNMCPECDATGRKITRTPQPWDKFAIGDLEGYTVLGPIHGMLWAADLVRDPQQRPEYCSIGPDEKGNLAALLVKDPGKVGQPMYLMGGRLQLQFLS